MAGKRFNDCLLDERKTYFTSTYIFMYEINNSGCNFKMIKIFKKFMKKCTRVPVIYYYNNVKTVYKTNRNLSAR